MDNTTTNRTKAGFRFAALYILGLFLVFVVVSAFIKGNNAGAATASASSEREQYFVQYDTLLHARLDAVDNRYASFLKSLRNGGGNNPSGFLEAKNAFGQLLDSLDQQASYLNEGVKKEVMTALTARFRQAYSKRYNLVSELGGLPKEAIALNDRPAEEPSLTNAEIEELKRLLVEKDQRIAELQKAPPVTANTGNDNVAGQYLKEIAAKDQTIASLQTQLKQKDAALLKASQTGATNRPTVATPANSSGDAEWRQRYASLKSAYDKVSASEKSLKSAYKTVADDNRRLLGQLQSIRKD